MNLTYRSEKEVFQILYDFENKHGMFNFIVDGISVWQLLRQPVATKLQNLSLSKEPLPKLSIISASIEGLKLWKLFSLRGKAYLAFTYYSGTRFYSDGQFEDVWFDFVLRAVPGGAKIQKLNAVGYEERLKKAAIQHGYDLTFLCLLASVFSNLFPRKSGLDTFGKIAAIMHGEFDVELISSTKIEKIYNYFYWSCIFNRFLIKILKPKSCLVPDSGEFSLLYACKKEKISYIELQHGVFTRYHPHSLPVSLVAMRSTLLLPDHIAVYGDYWKNELRGTLQGVLGLVVSVGNGILDKYRTLKLKNSSKIPSVVLTTQGLNTEKLVEFISAALSGTRSEFHFVIKLHPSYDRSAVPYEKLLLNDKRVQIVMGSQEPSTYDLISNARLHLSVSSACHYDSLSIGTPTGVIKLSGYELMIPILKEGTPLISNPEELSGIIDRMIRTEEIFRDNEKFCKSNFSSNLSKILNE